MNVLFATQSQSLNLFADVADAMRAQGALQRAGFTVADRQYFDRWSAANPGFESAQNLLLKEWKLTSTRADAPDWALLRRYEDELGGPGLFGAIVGDRRLLMGPGCTYTQDYRRRFSDDELWSILQASTVAVDRMFTQLKPDLVVTFVCVTILDYLVHLFALARGIRTLNLRPAKLGNNMLAVSTLRDPAPEIATAYARALTGGSPRLAEARERIMAFRQASARYEGVVPPSARPARPVRLWRGPAGGMRFLRSCWRYRRSGAAEDNHSPGLLRPLLFGTVVNPLRARRTERRFRTRYVTVDALRDKRYAFYPLHTEPEVSLMVYGRPYLNQIEVVRAVALSLPADMVLVVKEHPWMVGKRSVSALEKLLAIPRVRLAAPESEARALVEQAALVTVLTSSVGQEAALLGRPVLTLGPCPFNLLPETMVRRVVDLTVLPETIRELLAAHRADEQALEAYVAALLDCSVGVNFYTGLLGRTDAHADHSADRDADVAKLSDFLLQQAGIAPSAVPSNAARW